MNRNKLLAIVWILAVSAAPVLAQRRNDAVEVKVDNLEATPVGVSITLRASNSDQELHMMIGVSEGEAIARAMDNQKPPRPMTHDLIKMILDRTGWQVQKVVIRAISGNTYLADLVLQKKGETQVLDARPSDAMAVALRCGAKIYVNPEVFDVERQRNQPEHPEQETPSGEQGLHI